MDGSLKMGVFRIRKLIPVRYPDGRVDRIPLPLLNTMIEAHKIVEFKRKEGWVIIGRDPIRGMGHGQVCDEERRRH